MKDRFVIGAIGALLVIALAEPTLAQTTPANGFVSPCPNVFMYEPPGSEIDKWYGLVNLTTETTLYALWLNIVLESKADVLGNWVGEVTTEDNIDFKIENTKMKISPGPPLSVRFFVKYNPQEKPPRLQTIRFNGREICDVKSKTKNNITTTTVRSKMTTSRNIDRYTTSKPLYWTQANVGNNNYQIKTDTKQQTTLKPQYWTVTNTTTTKPQYWQVTKVDYTHQVKSENRQQTTSKPQQWTQAKVEENNPIIENLDRPIWPHIKVDNFQLNQSDTKLKPQDISQINTLDKIQSTVQHWPQTQDANNQQKRTQDGKGKPEVKEPTKIVSTFKTQTENLLQTFEKTTTQSSLWGQFKVENKHQTKFEDKLKTKNENRSQTTVKTLEDVKIKSDKNLESISHTRHETGQQIRQNERLQISPEEHHRADTIYVLPENNTASIISDDKTNYFQTVPKDNTQILSQFREQTKPYTRIVEDKLQIRHDGRLEVRPINRQEDENVNRQPWTEDTNLNWSVDRTKSSSNRNRPKDRIIFESADESTRYSNDGSKKYVENRDRYYDHQLTTVSPPRTQATVPDIYDEVSEDVFFGGLPTIFIPNHASRRTESQCGKVFLNEESPDTRRGPSTLEGQWPWQIALYQQQTTVDFKYICGGTLVSRSHIITAAHCVTKKGSRNVVTMNSLTVYLGKHNLRTSVKGVQVKFVKKITIHPEYNAATFSRDLAILELMEPVTFTNWVQPVCLWPEDLIPLSNIVGERGSVVGWGFDSSGKAREELNLLEMPIVAQEACINPYIDLYISEYTYCAGYAPGTLNCNEDSGGGMVFQRGGSWYLRGLASLSISRQGLDRCSPDNYVIFTDIAKLMPWVEEYIDD